MVTRVSCGGSTAEEGPSFRAGLGLQARPSSEETAGNVCSGRTRALQGSLDTESWAVTGERRLLAFSPARLANCGLSLRCRKPSRVQSPGGAAGWLPRPQVQGVRRPAARASPGAAQAPARGLRTCRVALGGRGALLQPCWSRRRGPGSSFHSTQGPASHRGSPAAGVCAAGRPASPDQGHRSFRGASLHHRPPHRGPKTLSP